MPDPMSAPNSLWKVGSSPNCDIVIDQPIVSGEHCRLSLLGDQYVLEDLGSTNGTYVNGYRLDPRSPVYVSSTDRVTLGRQLPMPWPALAQNSARPSSSQAINIGRGSHNEIRLDYPMISREHARITRSGQQ